MIRYAPCILPLLLAGCGERSVELQNASVAEVADKVKQMQRIEPGEWRASSEIVGVELAGARDDPMAAAIGKHLAGRKTDTRSCITPEQAENPGAEFFQNSDHGSCRYDRFKMAGGRIDAAMRCTAKDRPGSMTMKMAGTYTATAYAIETRMEMAAPGDRGMTMTARAKGQRIGACKPTGERI